MIIYLLIQYLTHISCTTAAILKAPFCKSSPSSSNNSAVRQPHPFGALGNRVPGCLKLPNTITSLFDGQISCKSLKKKQIIFRPEHHIEY
ncbi:hypothetical protein Hanom_Chr04g00321371 [Helianthus anomalus]